MGTLEMTGLMTRAKTFAAVALSAAMLAVAAPAIAQEVSPEQLALARQYIDLTDRASIYEVTLVEIGVGTMRQIVQQNPTLSEEVGASVTKILEEYRGRKGELLDQFARVYAARFTVEELGEIIAFYESPTGKKLSEANGDVNKDLQAVLRVFTGNARSEIFAKVRADLRAQGFEV